jgi:hypothetical protein
MTLDKERLEVAFEAYWAAEGGTFKSIEAAIAAYLNCPLCSGTGKVFHENPPRKDTPWSKCHCGGGLGEVATPAKIIEECAKVVEPKGPRPCDCERCDCGNHGDLAAVAAWDADMANAKAIRALALSSQTCASGLPIDVKGAPDHG